MTSITPNRAAPLGVPHTCIRRIEADGINFFHRRAGAPDAPVVLLLHGFTTSSFQYREPISCLATQFSNQRTVARFHPGGDPRHRTYPDRGIRACSSTGI
jgi:pimeloyl-ACP methyl ester carboxylesterase